MEKKNKMTVKSMVMAGMFAAVLAVLSQISIPMPSGVPVTLQTFAVALTGFVLGWKLGGMAVVIYVLLGAVGVPVFANLNGGIGVLVGTTGGFIWGFILMVLLCGLGTAQKSKVMTGIFSALGLAVCHLAGILQFCGVMGMGFAQSALLVSIPYLVKDIISMVLAFLVGVVIRRYLNAANILSYERAKQA
ncbi:MAG: biotin transporter BioY [Lachnospiraceae bacterium]|nr:biotin transporter BioY [Lachnospiraceae bacterium]